MATELSSELKMFLDAVGTDAVDTHVHLWDHKGDGIKLTWLTDIPKIDKKFSIEEFAEHTLPATPLIGRWLFMETGGTSEQAMEELAWLKGLMARESRLVGGVFRSPVELGDGCREQTTALKADPTVKGIRRLIQGEGLGFCNTPDFIKGVQIVGELGLPFDLCVFHPQLPDVIELVTACPGTQFVLDHFGKPDAKAHVLDPWREHITALAALPNVVAKLSGITTEADMESWTFDDLEPYFKHLVTAFGEDRLVMGGDWPVSFQATTYPRWIETVVRGLEAGFGAPPTPAQLRKVFVENPSRVYGLETVAAVEGK